jgi:hypothetical protein
MKHKHAEAFLNVKRYDTTMRRRISVTKITITRTYTQSLSADDVLSIKLLRCQARLPGRPQVPTDRAIVQ